MKILILGATGGTGLHCVRAALAAGHALTLLVRSPAKLPPADAARCTVLVGDAVTDGAAMASAAKGQDAVLVCLGSRSLWSRQYDCSLGTRALLGALKAEGASPRIVVCSSMGTAESAPWIPSFVQWMLKHPLADKVVQEAEVRASGCPFVLVRPTGLNDGAPRGPESVAAVEGGPVPTSQISRCDVAQFMLAQLADTPFLGKAVGISWKK